jgi:hypothetical protein
MRSAKRKPQGGLGSMHEVGARVTSKPGQETLRTDAAHEWTSDEARGASHQHGAARNWRITGLPERGATDSEEET